MSDVTKSGCRILVIKLRHLGDVLLTSPMLTQLQKMCPGALIDVYIYRESLPMLEGHPAVRKFHLCDKKKSVKEWLAVRKERYDVVINLTEGDRGALLALVSGAKMRVGIDPGKSGFFKKRSIFTHLIKHAPHPRHTVEKNLDALRVMGLFPDDERDVTLHIPDEAYGQVCGDYVVVHPVSRWLFKCLPIQVMAGVIRGLHAEGRRIVLTSGPSDAEMAMIAAILDEVGELPLLNLAGKTSLKELAALIDRAELLICVDSVPLHIASATKTPTVTVFGPSSEENWGPWRNPNARVITPKISCRPCYHAGCASSGKSDCLNLITIAEMLAQSRHVAPARSQRALASSPPS